MSATLTTALLAVPAVSAQAKVFQVNGKQTTITPSASLVSFLAAHKVGVSAIAPATLSASTLTFPITGGKVRTPSLNGSLIMSGGLQFTRKKRSVTLTSLVALHHGTKNTVTAVVGGRRRAVARATGVHVSISGKTGTISGELRLSAAAAGAINRLAGRHLVSAGADLGSFTSTVTVA